jgi:preprotein translocase subunit SecF
MNNYSFLKWIIITVFSLVVSIMLFKLNLNYFAELAKKDEIDLSEEEKTNEEKTIEEETIEENHTEKENVNLIPQDDIGSKTLPKT